MKQVNSFLGSEIVRRKQAWQQLRAQLVPALPSDYLQHVTYGVADDKKISLFTDSAAWTAKIRFYDSEIKKVLAAAGRQVRQVQVKTAPQTDATANRPG